MLGHNGARAVVAAACASHQSLASFGLCRGLTALAGTLHQRSLLPGLSCAAGGTMGLIPKGLPLGRRPGAPSAFPYPAGAQLPPLPAARHLPAREAGRPMLHSAPRATHNLAAVTQVAPFEPRPSGSPGPAPWVPPTAPLAGPASLLDASLWPGIMAPILPCTAATAGSLMQSQSGPKAPLCRPQFHVMPASGWVNDPNGPIYHNGVYHM